MDSCGPDADFPPPPQSCLAYRPCCLSPLLPVCLLPARLTQFLQRKWAKELGYVLRKYLWAYTNNRISVNFEYEFHDDRCARQGEGAGLQMKAGGGGGIHHSLVARRSPTSPPPPRAGLPAYPLESRQRAMVPCLWERELGELS